MCVKTLHLYMLFLGAAAVKQETHLLHHLMSRQSLKLQRGITQPKMNNLQQTVQWKQLVITLLIRCSLYFWKYLEVFKKQKIDPLTFS